MKRTTDSGSKNFNSKLWISVISIILCVTTVAAACLGVALLASNDKVEALRSELMFNNETIMELNGENQLAKSEIDSLKSGLTLTDEELDALTAELSALKTALTQSKENQVSLENSIVAMENTNKSSQAVIDQLKSELENAKGEIATLKEQQKESENKIRIYIDQGHNPAPYHNSGASGNGLYEQDITFLVGCLLANILNSDGRFEVKLSRPNKSVVLGTDNKSSLAARVEGAAEFNADYLISLHTNSFDQESANGIEVYVAKETGESYVFGESLLDGLIDSTKLKDRGMKLNPDLDILEFSAMPAVLVEMGFISNSTDAELMSEHPELFAEGIYNGILAYFGLLPNARPTA